MLPRKKSYDNYIVVITLIGKWCGPTGIAETPTDAHTNIDIDTEYECRPPASTTSSPSSTA